MVEQPAGRGDQYLDVGAKGAFLWRHADAAEDGRAAQPGVAREHPVVLGGLRGEASRVGDRTNIRGPELGLRGGVAPRRASAGSRNAAVLPLPVMAQAIRSRPSRAGGIARA